MTEATGSRPPAHGEARRTRQGDAVLRAVQASAGFRSAQDIHAQLRQSGEGVGLTTVYRHLQSLSERGVINALQAADGQVLYRYCELTAHHHHLVCRRCGASAEIDEPDAENWAQAVAEQMGFTDITHTIEIFGVCASCSQA